VGDSYESWFNTTLLPIGGLERFQIATLFFGRATLNVKRVNVIASAKDLVLWPWRDARIISGLYECDFGRDNGDIRIIDEYFESACDRRAG
jgi:hypothetical protein